MDEATMTKVLLACLLLGALSRQLGAAEEITPAAGLAFPSIEEGGTARAIALGSAYVGIAEGSSSLLWNPAGLGGLIRPEIALHHTIGLVGASQDIAVLGLPLGARSGLGLSINYEDNGAFDGRDANGNATGGYSSSAFGGSVGWGIQGPVGLSAGLALKANRQDLAGTDNETLNGDLGVLWSANPELSLGAAYNNLGPYVQGQPVAQGLSVGLSKYFGLNSDFEWLLALSGESLTHGGNSIHLGLEHTLYRFLALRAGYAFDMPDPMDASLLGWTFGGGFFFHNISLDYAFVPMADLGNTQRVSLTYVFGGRPMKDYIVKAGDSLWSISGKQGVRDNSFQWPLLQNSNKDQVKDPNVIVPNEDLKFKAHYSTHDVNNAEQRAVDTPPFTPGAAAAPSAPLAAPAPVPTAAP
jgi:hypothetical protein